MKHNIKIHFTIAGLFLVLFAGLFSCQDDYIIGGDVHNPQSDLTTYDYLKAHSRHDFDTTLMIIDHCGMKELINGNVTFFVPNNYTINNFLKQKKSELNVIDENLNYTLDSLYKEYPVDSLKKMMSKYIFQGKITRDNLTKDGTLFSFQGNADDLFNNGKGIIQNPSKRLLTLEEVDAYTVPGVITTYPKYIYYTMVLGDRDIEGKDPSGNEDYNDRKILVQTSGILTTNGVIHVLANSHTWTFWTYNK